MTISDERPLPGEGAEPKVGSAYSIHPLSALDGVMIYVTRNGEAVGSYFGKTEEAAARAVAEHLARAVANTPEGGSA